MKEFWEDLEGWFNFYDLYLEMINKFDAGIFVEIGCWKGKSAGYMAINLRKAKKTKIDFYTIDIFEPYMQSGVLEQGVTLEEAKANLASVKKYVNIIKANRDEAITFFEDGSIDFLFLDANHDYEAVKADLNAWFPKMKEGGIMAGHDYQWSGVEKAVNEFFEAKGMSVKMIEASGSWITTI